jgi:hypothetical protein
MFLPTAVAAVNHDDDSVHDDGIPMRGRVLAVFAAIGLAAALSSCSGPGGSPHSGAAAGRHASGSAESAAYRRIGGRAQGVSVEVPSSWTSVDFSHQTVQQAIRVIGAQGSTETALTQTLTPLARLHAAYAADVSSEKTAPGHFMTNLNGYCADSGISQTGSVGAAVIGRAWASELQQIGARDLTQTAAKLGTVAGVESSYTLSASTAGTLHAVQLQALPKPGQACFVTLTAAGQVPATVLAQAISSIQYP